ncbi:MAG: HDOD domain-containing protein, partial [Deltaproteobacteria bacterium]|nr:HDOD domain-containing protein [Deltaproteobacteria bacterium]
MAYPVPLIRKLFEKDPSLPSLPDHTRRLLEILRKEDTPLTDIAREVENDPVLALRLIRLANSAAYSLGKEVNSLERALAVVGVTQISSIAASFASVDSCERFLGASKFHWKDFWAHCSGTAFIAKALAERLEVALNGTEFLAGLLHDIGYLALAKVDPALFGDAVREASEKNGFLASGLKARFGLTVEAAGDLLAEVSRVAPETREVIRHLHDPLQAPA